MQRNILTAEDLTVNNEDVDPGLMVASAYVLVETVKKLIAHLLNFDYCSIGKSQDTNGKTLLRRECCLSRDLKCEWT